MTRQDDIPVLIVFGPTASGKTTLASKLFSSEADSPLSGRVEIISADSMQVYRGLDIGTAKPDAPFLQKLPHHLIDICDPREQFCAGDFVRLADSACAEIASREKLPVLLGGTAFYIRNFLYGLPETPVSDPEIRKLLRARMDREGAPVLYRELLAVDPERGAQIHPHDEYRIIRALEVYTASGKTVGSFQVPLKYRTGYRFLVISLTRTRDILYARINARVDDMFASGLPAEFLSLLSAGYTAEDPGMQAIGYREFFGLNGDRSNLEEIRYQIKQDTRKYAKRQETFINTLPDVIRLDPDDIHAIEAVIESFYTSKA